MKSMMISALSAIALTLLSSGSLAAEDCDALPHNVGFCPEGSDWQAAPENADPLVMTYFNDAIVLQIAQSFLPSGTVVPQDELRQVLNRINEDGHIQTTGRALEYWIEDELTVDETLANRSVYTTYYSGTPAVYAETLMLFGERYLTVLTVERTAEFTEAHIEAHEDALARITLK